MVFDCESYRLSADSLPVAPLRERQARQGRVQERGTTGGLTLKLPRISRRMDRSYGARQFNRQTRLESGQPGLLPGQKKHKTPKKERNPQIMRPKKVILCVDDNEQELSVLSFMLTTNGYKVIPATSGQEAISLFSQTQVDLVLTDFAMPQMNGHQLVNRLKQLPLPASKWKGCVTSPPCAVQLSPD